MARGLTRDQIGVTEEMIATFGDLVFRMSHNYQERTGDPVRNLDWAAIERQQEDMGLTDQQIGDKLGLTRNQALFIRTVMERRRFRTGHHSRLLELGGGKRFRAERFTPELNHFRYGEAALALRAAIRFDPERVREYVRRGWWRDDTISKWLARHAAESPDAPALIHAGAVTSWQQLSEKVARLAGALHQAGIAKGDVVAVQLPNIPEFIVAYFAIARLGAVPRSRRCSATARRRRRSCSPKTRISARPRRFWRCASGCRTSRPWRRSAARWRAPSRSAI
jgi:AMP-binding enzyme